MRYIAIIITCLLIPAFASSDQMSQRDAERAVGLRLIAPAADAANRARLLWVAGCLDQGYPSGVCWMDVTGQDLFRQLVELQEKQDRNEFLDAFEEHMKAKISELLEVMNDR